jgi:hypothetical protein
MHWRCNLSFMRCDSATRLLLNHGATARHRDADGMTALHLAVRGNYPDTVSPLVQVEAWLDEQDGKGHTKFTLRSCLPYEPTDAVTSIYNVQLRRRMRINEAIGMRHRARNAH